MTRRLRLLHVIPSISLSHGGPSRAIVMMEMALAVVGVSVTTATTDDGGPGRRLAIDARLTQANGTARIYARKWLEFYKVAPGMVPWLWRNVRRFDVVHIHALFSFTSIAAAIIARFRGVPYVIRPLGTLTTYGVTQRRPWLKRLSLWLIDGPILRHSAAVHFTSQAEWEEAKFLGVPFRGFVIPLAVELPTSGEDQLLIQAHPIIEGRRRMLYLSRLDPKKNVEGLLRAFSLMTRRRSDLVLLIAGWGPSDYIASLEALATSLHIERDVIWLGHVEDARKAAAFAVADVFVLPSFSENFGTAAAEALLAELPCVLGQGVAIASDVQEAGAGLVVAPEPRAIAEALEQILIEDTLRREMGVRGKAFAEREYSMPVMARRLVALYEEIRSPRERHAA